MNIRILPSEIVKRCLWDNYVYYIVGSEKEAEKILKEDLEFEVSERDALVIGLLKIIETNNLIHKFNTHVVEFLTNKSIMDPKKSGLLIRKKTFDFAIDKFLDKFPDYWTPPINYSNALKDLVDYIDELKEKIEKLEILRVTVQNVSYEFYNTNAVKKLLRFNY